MAHEVPMACGDSVKMDPLWHRFAGQNRADVGVGDGVGGSFALSWTRT